MKVKLIVYLLALCLTLALIPVQAQTDTGNITSLMITKNIDETITCNLTANTVVVGNETESAQYMENVTGNKTCTLTNGKVAVIKDLANKTTKVVVIGKLADMPGTAVIFGKVNYDMKGNMSENAGEAFVLASGNVTGDLKCDLRGNATDKVTRHNITALKAGNVTGTLTANMNEKKILLQNVQPGNETNIIQTVENMSKMDQNQTCSIEGKMVIISTEERLGEMSAYVGQTVGAILGTGGFRAVDAFEGMNVTDRYGNAVILGNVNLTRGENLTEQRVAGKIVIVRNMDEGVGIYTRTLNVDLSNVTASRLIVRGMQEGNISVMREGNVSVMQDNMSMMREDNMSDNMSNMTD